MLTNAAIGSTGLPAAAINALKQEEAYGLLAFPNGWVEKFESQLTGELASAAGAAASRQGVYFERKWRPPKR